MLAWCSTYLVGFWMGKAVESRGRNYVRAEAKLILKLEKEIMQEERPERHSCNSENFYCIKADWEKVGT
jgi:hypothetical protein